MKVNKFLIFFLFLSFFVQINLNAQNHLPMIQQNGLNFIQALDEDTKIKIVNAIDGSPIQGLDSCVLYDDRGKRYQGNLYIWNEKGKLIQMQMGLMPFIDEGWPKPLHGNVYGYDLYGNKTLEESYIYTHSKTDPKTKSEFKYDDRGNCIEKMSTTYDFFPQTHVDQQMQITNTYNNENQQVEQITTMVSQPDVWRKYLYTYDEEGNLTVYEDILSFEDISPRYTYTYDSNNYVIEEKYERVKDGEVQSEVVTSYVNAYEGEKLMSSIAVDADGVKLSETEYTYDDRGNKTSIINYNFDEYTEDRMPVSRLLTTYDGKDNLTFYERTIWDSVKKKWVGEPVSPTGNEGLQGRKEWTYDEDGNVATVKYYQSNTGNNGEFSLHRSIVFYYTKQGADITNESVQDVSVSVEGELLVVESPAIEDISLFSLTGQKVLNEKKGDVRITFSVSYLSKGVYIVKGSSGWTRKVNL